jgi:hypothetical protein
MFLSEMPKLAGFTSARGRIPNSGPLKNVKGLSHEKDLAFVDMCDVIRSRLETELRPVFKCSNVQQLVNDVGGSNFEILTIITNHMRSIINNDKFLLACSKSLARMGDVASVVFLSRHLKNILETIGT